MITTKRLSLLALKDARTRDKRTTNMCRSLNEAEGKAGTDVSVKGTEDKLREWESIEIDRQRGRGINCTGGVAASAAPPLVACGMMCLCVLSVSRAFGRYQLEFQPFMKLVCFLKLNSTGKFVESLAVNTPFV